MSACGELHYRNLTLQWTKSHVAAELAMDQLAAFGVPVGLHAAPGLPGRWKVMRELIANLDPKSLLDVGGFGEYKRSARTSRCINIHAHRGCDIYAAGTALPYRNGRFHTVLLETVLHHAADNALQLLDEAARVARKYVIVAEDVLDNRASKSVVDSYRSHDPWAIYRSTSEWIKLGQRSRLALRRIAVLDRVPLHVAREARPECQLNYPPMQYLVFCVGVCFLGS